MNVRLVRQFGFEAAHHLTKVPSSHPCGCMHGHSYRVELALEGPVDPAIGWLIDFGDIDKAWQKIKVQVDHKVLNTVSGLENPTCENLTLWMWQHLRGDLPQLTKVTVWETADARCEYEGP